MPKFLQFISALLIASISTAAIAAEKNDPEAGYLVYSIGTEAGLGGNFGFNYRQLSREEGQPGRLARGLLDCTCIGIWRAQISNPDYLDAEAGRVYVKRLPPGKYEVFRIATVGTIVVATVVTSTNQEFSIPFTIVAGRATYIGNYQRFSTIGKASESRFGYFGYYVVSDKSARDLPIARKKSPQLPDVDVMVVNADQLGMPMILSRPVE